MRAGREIFSVCRIFLRLQHQLRREQRGASPCAAYDRGEIIIGNGVSISDYANVYSHGHDTLAIEQVSCGRTVIGDDARVTYHSTVLSGITIGADAMLGSHGLATRNIPDHAIHGGVPARPIAVKKR